MARVLVTGAGGYIGTTLVPMLLAAGHKVRAVDRFFFGEDLLADSPDLEKINADVRLLAPEHLQGIDAVIDLAAISNDPSGDLFGKATWEINHLARARCARMAKEAGVKRYVLPSSCSIYGFQDPANACTETSTINPLTTYAAANGAAERDALPLADDKFTVVVLRQSTVYGYSPRMRFDLAINGMTLGGYNTGKLPLMRDGSQWRPMVHVRDTASAQIFMLTAPAEKVNGQIFNVGSEGGNYQLGPLAEEVSANLANHPKIEWYGDVDHRSYRVNFDKIEALGWKATRTAADAVKEIAAKLADKSLSQTPKTITLQWYKELISWQERIKEMEARGNGGLIDIPGVEHLKDGR